MAGPFLTALFFLGLMPTIAVTAQNGYSFPHFKNEPATGGQPKLL